MGNFLNGIIFCVIAGLTLGLGISIVNIINLQSKPHIHIPNQSLLSSPVCIPFNKKTPIIDNKRVSTTKDQLLAAQCVLLNSAEVQSTVSELRKLTALRRQEDSLNSMHSIVVAIVSLVLAGVALLTLNLYNTFKKLIKDKNKEISNFSQLTKQFSIVAQEISNNTEKDLLIDQSSRLPRYKLEEICLEKSTQVRYLLEALAWGNKDDKQKASLRLNRQFYFHRSPKDCTEFQKFLTILQKVNPSLKKGGLLELSRYFKVGVPPLNDLEKFTNLILNREA